MKIHSMSSSSTCFFHTKLITVSTTAAVAAKALDIGFRNSYSYYSRSAGLRRILAWATI